MSAGDVTSILFFIILLFLFERYGHRSNKRPYFLDEKRVIRAPTGSVLTAEGRLERGRVKRRYRRRRQPARAGTRSARHALADGSISGPAVARGPGGSRAARAPIALETGPGTTGIVPGLWVVW